MNGWWTEIEAEIRAVVQLHPAVTLEELAGHLRMSDGATSSVLRVLMVDQPGRSLVVL